MLFQLNEGKILDIVDNPNNKRYPNQKVIVIEIKEYIYYVDITCIFRHSNFVFDGWDKTSIEFYFSFDYYIGSDSSNVYNSLYVNTYSIIKPPEPTITFKGFNGPRNNGNFIYLCIIKFLPFR